MHLPLTALFDFLGRQRWSIGRKLTLMPTSPQLLTRASAELTAFLRVFVGSHGHGQVLALQRATGPVQDAIAICVLKTHVGQQRLGRIRRIRVVDHRLPLKLRRYPASGHPAQARRKGPRIVA